MVILYYEYICLGQGRGVFHMGLAAFAVSNGVVSTKHHRPWGFFEHLDERPGSCVKRLSVRPRHALSLQRHYHRSEHWVVSAGVAEVTVDEEQFTLNKGESVYIPLGSLHRLRNIGLQDLQVIEVQTGDYLGEDDIERVADIYGRI